MASKGRGTASGALTTEQALRQETAKTMRRAQAASKRKVLVIEDVVDVPTVEIKGVAYDIATRGRLSVWQQVAVGRLQTKLDALDVASFDKLDVMSEEGEARTRELTEILDALVAFILPDLPATKRKKLTFDNKTAIVGFFTEQSGITLPS
jgi:hypothetical protein